MAERKTSEVLREARELISDPKRWTQGAFARTADGDLAPSIWRDAVSWCNSGAVERVGCFETVNAMNALIRAIASDGYGTASGCRSVSNYNDSHTHAEVLALFDRAIAEREAAGD